MTRVDRDGRGRKPFWQSVRFRLTLWYVALFGLALLVFGGGVYVLDLRRAETELQAQLQSDARDLANTFSPKDVRLHPELLPSDRPVQVDKRDLALLIDADGTPTGCRPAPFVIASLPCRYRRDLRAPPGSSWPARLLARQRRVACCSRC